MKFSLRISIFGAASLVVSAAAFAAAAPLTPEAHDFFEAKIRPVLVAECYECHNAKKTKGGLRLDYRDGWQKGGDSGDAIVPGNPAQSLLIDSIKHTDPDLKMPAKSPKLDDAVIADFEKWIAMGAPDPRDEPPAEQASKPTWGDLLATRRTWWSLQPVQQTAPPSVKNENWSNNPIDRFLLAKMEAKGLAPAADADSRTFIRRLTFALIGLPPTPEEVAAFVAESSADRQAAIRHATDRLLASPQFGEHWARHWMDLMRYAETHGSEGDPPIPEAWRYRDYLVRAFNSDVPGDQLIREHLAGDLLPKPRVNPDGFNESILGTAQFRLVEHGFQPVDTLDDQVKTVDNQIDVVSKAFQGLTVSCARCHDHKFDAISQRDWTAMYGIFASCRPAQVTIDTPEALGKNFAEMARLQAQIKNGLADAWQTAVQTLGSRLAKAPREAEADAASPLYWWAKLGQVNDADFPAEWQKLTTELRTKAAETKQFNREHFRPIWDLAGDDYAQWFPYGIGLGKQPIRAGAFTIETQGERILSGLAPAGAFTANLSTKHNGLLTSPRFKIESDSISVRVSGGGSAMVRVIVDNYPLPSNPIFAKAILNSDKTAWVRLDTAYRKGSMAYLEFGTRDDLTRPLEEKTKDKSKQAKLRDGRSFFGASAVVFHDGSEPPREEPFALSALLGETLAAPRSAAELAQHYQGMISEAVRAWRDDQLAEPQRVLLDYLVQQDLLPVTLPELASLRPLVEKFRQLEAEIHVPRRAPGVLETVAYDAPFLPRGDHLKPGAAVPRGFLEVLDPQPYHTPFSGRLELANDIASAQNPLTARVMVNRVWYWLFGRGIVPTVDNFGRLGEKPTHPELLDFLAARFVADGSSIKEMIRFLVTTRAYEMSSRPSAQALEADPANELLSHFRVQRLEAEAIRDSLLAVSGELQLKMGGKSEAEAPRRSIYLKVQRTNLQPFLQVFDAPRPFTTLGRRDVTNVPAQSLALLNSPFVIEQAKHWADALVLSADDTLEARIRGMFEKAFARPPGDDELSAATNYLTTLAQDRAVPADRLLADESVWQDFAQSLFNLKEFIYLR